MKYSLVKTGPLVYIAMCLLYLVRLDVLFYYPLPLLVALAGLALSIFAYMRICPQTDKLNNPQALMLSICSSYIIAYFFNSTLLGEMDRLMSRAPERDRVYRGLCIGLMIPMGMLLLAICGNFSERIRAKKTKQGKTVSSRTKIKSNVFR